MHLKYSNGDTILSANTHLILMYTAKDILAKLNLCHWSDEGGYFVNFLYCKESYGFMELCFKIVT